MNRFKDFWFLDGQFYVIPSSIYFNQNLKSEVEEENEGFICPNEE